MSAVDIIKRVVGRLEDWEVPWVLVDGWEDRGRPSAPALDPHVVVCHHTATKGYQYDYASLGIVRDGRSDLPGPLSEFGLGRHTGTVYVIASGKANHAGEGGWAGYVGNSTAWGIEAENDGIGEEWGPEIRRSYLLLVAALCIETPIAPAACCEHYEWSPYKIDRANFGDPDSFRAEVAVIVAANGPTEPPQEDGMAAWSDNDSANLERLANAADFIRAMLQDFKAITLTAIGGGKSWGLGMLRIAHAFLKFLGIEHEPESANEAKTAIAVVEQDAAKRARSAAGVE